MSSAASGVKLQSSCFLHIPLTLFKKKKAWKELLVSVWEFFWTPTPFPDFVASFRGEKHEWELNPDLQHSSRDLLEHTWRPSRWSHNAPQSLFPAVVSNAGWCPLGLRETLKQRSSFSTSWVSCCVGPIDAISYPTTESLFWCWQVPWHVTHRTDGCQFHKWDFQMMA